MLGRWLRRFFRRGDTRATANSLLTEAAALLEQRDFAAACEKVLNVLTLDPSNASAFHMRGVCLCSMGQFEDGLEALRTALRLDAKNSGICLDYGNALLAAGNDEDAEVAFRQSIGLTPGFGLAHRVLGSLLLAKSRFEEGSAEFARALEGDPDDREALRGLALAAYLTFDYLRACGLYSTLHEQGLLELNDRYYFGFALQQTGRLNEAREVLKETLALAPHGSPVSHMTARTLGLCQLLSGNWEEGFYWQERRFDAIKLNTEGDANGKWLNFIDVALAGTPVWTEGDCEGKRVLVWVEQGLGDSIMMMRFLPVLLEDCHAAAVSFLCAPPLATFEKCHEDIQFLVPTPAWNAQPGQYDLHCSIMSLPHLLRVRPERIPGRVPYIRVSRVRREAWRDRTAQLAGLRVGIAWAGSSVLALDKLRSIALDQLKPLLAVEGVSFVSLQKDEAAREELRQRNVPIVDWMDDCGDFMETAALMDSLDLIISVDTAVAHLAGAIGKPVWLLNRFESEWRWMRDREDSVWYPSMRIFNQTEPRHWKPVIDRMANELRGLVRNVATTV